MTIKNVLKKPLVIFVIVWAITLYTTLITLVIVNIISWNWFTGSIIGLIVLIIGIYFFRFSVKQLVSTENPYFYYFLYVIRIGIYAVPFLISIFANEYFSIFGVLISFSGVIFIPFLNKLNP